MKRNESILVYGVTGLLVLILFVAVVFGNEGEALARPDNDENAAAGEPDDFVIGPGVISHVRVYPPGRG